MPSAVTNLRVLFIASKRIRSTRERSVAISTRLVRLLEGGAACGRRKRPGYRSPAVPRLSVPVRIAEPIPLLRVIRDRLSGRAKRGANRGFDPAEYAYRRLHGRATLQDQTDILAARYQATLGTSSYQTGVS